MTRSSNLRLRLSCAWLVALCCGAMLGCRAPVGADRTSVSRVYQQLGHSALDGGTYSDFTRAVLHRCACDAAFGRDPESTLRQLHNKALVDERHDILLALAELNYYHAEHLRRSVKPGQARRARDYFLSSCLYAYYYLLNQSIAPQPEGFGPHPHLAAELYNYALAQGFLAPGKTNAAILLETGLRQLPLGPVELQINTNAFPWPLPLFGDFIMADAYSIRGLSVRNRQVGLGAPLVGTTRERPSEFGAARVAATVFLRPMGELKQWEAGQLKAVLELYPGYPDTRVVLGTNSVPLEVDATAPLAYALNDESLWRLGRKQFFSGREIIKSGVYRLQPYRPGAIPIVFIHGTYSSPVRWAEMWNTLSSDPVLSRRCQFWAYSYNTGNPVMWSGANLRDALTQTVKELDPTGKDPAFRQIVLIGHSQGGLLAKLSVTRSGDRLWRTISDQSLDELDLPTDVRAALARSVFVEPVPSVSRVIFVATPHRGSYRATRLLRRMAARVISLPADLARFATLQKAAPGMKELPPEFKERTPTSLDGMSPKSPILLTLAEISPEPGVTSHSIIAVKGNGPVEKGSDGVVTYQSAHVTYTTSEFIVRSRHSCQGNPAVIEEVRRILLEHLAQMERAPPDVLSSE